MQALGGLLGLSTLTGGNMASLPIRGPLTDRSGTITSGATSQQLAAANLARSYIFIQNISIHDLWINFGAAATAGTGSILLAGGTATVDGNDPGGSFVMESGFISADAVNIIGGTTSQAFTAKEG